MNKLFISDLDGTLLSSNHFLSKYTRNSLVNLLKRKDFYFSIGTGRDYYFMKTPIRGLKFSLPLISFEGALVSQESDPKPLYIKSLEQSLFLELYKIIKKHNFACFFDAYYRDKIFLFYDSISNFYEHWLLGLNDTFYKHKRIKFSHIDNTVPIDVLMLFVIGLDDEIKSAYRELEPFKDRVKIAIFSRPEFDGVSILYMQHKQAEKVYAIEFLADYLNIPLKDVVFFGDAENDIPVFENAQIHSVAVSNAISEVKELAKEVIGHHNDDAVIKYIETKFQA